jgi:hypothetical protein
MAKVAYMPLREIDNRQAYDSVGRTDIFNKDISTINQK